MTYIQALFLGIVQGLTEFLPISSSAHLVFIQHLFHIKEPMLFFDIMLHLGTLASILIFFRNDLLKIIRALMGVAHTEPGDAWQITQAQAWRYAAFVILGTIPAGIAGVLLGDVVESAFGGIRTAAVCLFVTGAVLFAVERARPGRSEAYEIAWTAILIIGLAQAVALLPGISRSGSTICAALFLGMNRNAAARFSFLLAIPAILGAAVLEGKDVFSSNQPLFIGPTVLGAAAAFLVGLFALYLLIGMLRNGKLAVFAVYCWAVGALVLGLSFAGK